MAVWNVKNFRSRRELIDYLNGVLTGSVNLHEGAAVDGKTLIIDLGAGDKTTTFAPPKSRKWTLAEIVAKIEAADPSLVGLTRITVMDGIGGVGGSPPDRRLSLFRDGAVIVKAAGTANALLGFAAGSDTVRAAATSTAVFRIDKISGEQDSWVLVTMLSGYQIVVDRTGIIGAAGAVVLPDAYAAPGAVGSSAWVDLNPATRDIVLSLLTGGATPNSVDVEVLWAYVPAATPPATYDINPVVDAVAGGVDYLAPRQTSWRGRAAAVLPIGPPGYRWVCERPPEAKAYCVRLKRSNVVAVTAQLWATQIG